MDQNNYSHSYGNCKIYRINEIQLFVYILNKIRTFCVDVTKNSLNMTKKFKKKFRKKMARLTIFKKNLEMFCLCTFCF